MSIVGHEQALAQIPNPLPPTLLLTGPEGVGKRRAADEMARRTGVSDLDFQNLGHLNRAAARRLIEHHEMSPIDSPVKVTVADLTRASPEAANAILKVLESPPPYSRIILHTDTNPLLTIRSRCFNVTFGTLSEAEVSTVLRRLPGVSDPEEAARYAHGRVSLGLAYARNTAARQDVESVLLAVAKQDPTQVEYALTRALAKDPSSDHDTKTTVLCRLLAQSLRSSLIDPAHALTLTVPLPLRLRALDILDSRSRPVLRARAATWVLLVG